MSIRDDLWDFIGEGRTRAEIRSHFRDWQTTRKALHRYTVLGEFVQDGETFRQGTKAVTGFRPWCEDELHVIRAWAPMGYDAIAEHLPTRTLTAIKQKALELKCGPVRSTRKQAPAIAWPAFTRGHISPVVRACIAEAA